ncbi:noncompact myelin-associated protein [Brienomyrus brachyistius]|uniref:noncompact myelin-associated protein n=1 Tax=Brienomyrus brachyistius TaxID=42636 RepID=UPI0020B2261B|nr:noncompact myelin-associated protein [Brienomyrus brachyistius]XP_048829847.1 noncompact myelin-associated protein [Brienomyrus brachyistius]XP_048829848.1 noncompact myelin-associated protein [Brienomyrus brachyistius]XP_048829849.1 noncompact myelin-associated protein [Brienomyrus brachyistius]XP_048829850.1 noncompact myelin-associated protein [Brienomyrus brachyistius]
MQSSTPHPVTNLTTLAQNTTTKSHGQILMQSSGAMIAVIVIGIVIILTILLIILKTYNRRTQATRMLRGSRPPKKSSTVHTNMQLHSLSASPAIGGSAQLQTSAENGFRLPRAEWSSMGGAGAEWDSTTSGSTVAAVHDAPPLENT